MRHMIARHGAHSCTNMPYSLHNLSAKYPGQPLPAVLPYICRNPGYCSPQQSSSGLPASARADALEGLPVAERGRARRCPSEGNGWLSALEVRLAWGKKAFKTPIPPPHLWYPVYCGSRGSLWVFSSIVERFGLWKKAYQQWPAGYQRTSIVSIRYACV